MNCDELQLLTAVGALGALDGADLVRWRERLREDAQAREDFARFCDVAAALAGTVERRRPSGGVRERVMERVRRTPQRPRGSNETFEPMLDGAGPGSEPGAASAAASGKPPVPRGFEFVDRDAPWLPAPLPGARYKVLSASPAQQHVLLMIELAPGAVYPEHDHSGTEDMYILTGDLQSEGRSLGPGDFLHAEPGSHHHELRTIAGCTALMIVPREAVGALVPG